MANQRPCFRCHGTKQALDYDQSKKQNKDVFTSCMGCGGIGMIWVDEEGQQLFKRYDETSVDFVTRIKEK